MRNTIVYLIRHAETVTENAEGLADKVEEVKDQAEAAAGEVK